MKNVHKFKVGELVYYNEDYDGSKRYCRIADITENGEIWGFWQPDLKKAKTDTYKIKDGYMPVYEVFPYKMDWEQHVKNL